MNRFLAALGALAMLGFAGIAQAEDASGRVATMDATMLILEDGTAFTIGEGVSVEGLQPGTEVTVSYEEIDGQKVATQISPAQ
ncbi:MAG: DUF1344 domain-containing protein [Kiloniellales bacterium]|nr:DUF1344 domain-containing protein [Kiloniellales bacterium]